MYGIVLTLAGIIFSSIFVFAIGLGLFVDELGYLMMGGKTHKDYCSKISLILSGLFIILVYFFREQLVFWI